MEDATLAGEREELTDVVRQEIDAYEEQIRKYRAGELDETKMQKQRLQFGTYAQRQEGVQMQRIKIPGGRLAAGQLECIADAADRFASGLIHFTTREDAQIYYVKLDEVPALLRALAQAGITTREACGNTVRNITCCYRAGTSPGEVFDVGPYAAALFRCLVRNKYNQNLGRKFKIAFEGCAEDHSRLLIHDIALAAQVRPGAAGRERGFRVWLGGGLGAAPHAARLYTSFLPEAELFNLVVATLRLFDRYGERKSRMKARLKFLVETMGWDRFVEELELERIRVGAIPLPETVRLRERIPAVAESRPEVEPAELLGEGPEFRRWAADSVIAHRVPGFLGVHVRLKLGDITSDRARGLAETARRFSAGELRVSIEQNIYLPWVRSGSLVDLYRALGEIGLNDPAAETVEDVTTCPGSDTCRLGIASAKGLGSALSEAFGSELAAWRERARPLRIRISGCPNACAQHSTADIGFQAAALNQDGRTIPAYLVFAGGRVVSGEAVFGTVVGRIPAKNGVRAVKALLEVYHRERAGSEDFGDFVSRAGHEPLKRALEPFKGLPAHEDDPSWYEDWGHENERFTVRQGVRGECAGSTVAETVPNIEAAREWLAQAEAYLYHEEWESAALAAYEAAARAARVPLYARLVDPFTSEEALWEFENLFVLSGQTGGEWRSISGRFEGLKSLPPTGESAREIVLLAREFVLFCAAIAGATSGKSPVPEMAAAQ